MKDARPFAFAGLWSQWKTPQGGATLETCAILTTTPNELTATVHDRMPVILPANHLEPLARRGGARHPHLPIFWFPFRRQQMEAFPVSKRVNSPANEGPDLIEPVQM